ncbi:hypothetical protein B7463_g5902, partial [Scytalidium lignicola]
MPTPSASMDYPLTTRHSDVFDSFTSVNIDWNLDWLFSTKFDEGFQPGQNSESSDRSFGISPNDQTQAHAAGESSPRDSHESYLFEEPSNGNNNLRSSQPQRVVDDPWPMEWHAVPVRISALPTLGGPDQDYHGGLTHFPTSPITESTISFLKDSLSLHLARSPWKPVSLSGFPGTEKINRCIDMYFKHFDWILPVVHRPTFDPAKEPVAESDAPYVRTEPYVTAQLLQASHGYASGSKRLFDLSESWRSSLVHNARCMGLFRYRQSTVVVSASLEERWHAWIADERFRRIGWAIYGCDSSASYLFNTRPYISVSDICMDLQSSTEHWEAETPQAWASLHPWSENGPRNLHFKTLIRSVFGGDEVASQSMTDDHHRVPIILTIIRMLWSCKETEANPLSDLLDDRARNERNRKYLLEVLDRFIHLPTDSPAIYTRLSRMDAVHRVMNIHIAHLIGAGNMMDWLYSLLRGGPDVENTRVRMKRWATQDPVRVREVAYRSSQILSLIRQYPYNLPQEPFDAFHAGTTLWCIAELLPQSNRSQDVCNAEAHQTVCRLDHLGNNNDPETVAIRAWIQDGGQRIISLYGVPDLCCEDGRRRILDHTSTILRRNRVWGIAQNFLEVISSLQQEDDEIIQ